MMHYIMMEGGHVDTWVWFRGLSSATPGLLVRGGERARDMHI
jgi:hypothetical protein